MPYFVDGDINDFPKEWFKNAKISTKEALKDNIQSKLSSLPLPKELKLQNEYNIIITGIGGTGVVTIGALLGMAAHIENKEVTVLDQIGLAQKGGAVISHVKMADANNKIFSSLINEISCNLLIGTDLVVSASKEVRDLISSKNTSSCFIYFWVFYNFYSIWCSFNIFWASSFTELI